MIIGHRRSVYQTVHELTCQQVRAIVAEGVRAGYGAPGGIGSPLWRVSATLYALLDAHQLDEQGRCGACGRRGRRGVGWRVGRARCGVDREAGFWLHQQEQYLASQAAHRWGLTPSPAIVGAAPDRAYDHPTWPLGRPGTAAWSAS